MAFQVSGFQPDFSPLVNGVNFPWKQDFMTWQARSWVARALLWAVARDFRQSSTVGREESEITVGRGWSLKPIMRKNGNLLVTEWGKWLCANSTWGIILDHEVGLVPQKMWRYVSTSWLTCSISPLDWR